jgi:hypothetical protein
LVFYNDANGMLMIRATPQDLAVLTAAIETLGGAPSPHPATADKPVGL